ncbi:MAG: hypothetical protein KJ852_06745 [Gammaproteobacteria bacterium]|jgi:hypothetical protein|nr:hypothetical protein [Gammaproteobacteria bacterium]MBU0786262.1 hypothetical protein [Gammaproteobacteria bacterium]MBU0814518.1 hypothetical protein [Gammaproteobacteria bacterium]MBU1786639.1 hypothetical protein [Gammaproteobacteria bacterium]
MKQSIWNIDIGLVFKHWLQDLYAFMLTIVTFMALSLPVVIPGLILWYMAGFPRLF